MSDTVLLEKQDRVALLTLNRPEALNALNREVLHAVTDHVLALQNDPDIGCIVITGNEKAFAAGADIKEMADQSYMDMLFADAFGYPSRLAECRLPIIAAVSGYALGGGCELAMACDMIVASETAKFGQPEIKLGVIPGYGGSQRLIRAVGKAKAMDLVLTGRMMDANEAEYSGLVARVVPVNALMDEAMKAAKTIAGYSRPAIFAAKEAVNRAEETTLTEGLLFERRSFHALFATEDQKEGMAAFTEKRRPNFKHR